MKITGDLMVKLVEENKQLKAELQQECTTREELQKQFEKDQKQIATLKSQLTNIKYLNADEVEHN